jgi:hypothetical protein
MRPTFEQDLYRSHQAVMLIAAQLTRRGNDVLIPGLKVRPDASQRAAFRDGGDLQIKHGNEWRAVEVKQRKNDFTGKHDYPYKDVIVDTCTIVDRLQPPALMYVVLNPSGTHAAIIDDKTRPVWTRKKITFPDRKGELYTREVYVCPVGYVRFVEVNR